MSNDRIIYLRELSPKTRVKYNEYHRRFIMENERSIGCFLVAPVLRRSLNRGVYFVDIDPRNEFIHDVLYTSHQFTRIPRGSLP